MLYPDQEGYNEESEFNIDIEFTAVSYIGIPNILEDIRITNLSMHIPSKLIHYKKDLDLNVFEIISKIGKYYIVAGGVRIGINKWGTDDRIANPSLEYDEIIEQFS